MYFLNVEKILVIQMYHLIQICHHVTLSIKTQYQNPVIF